MKIAYFVCSIYFGGVEKIVCDSLNELCNTHDTLLIVPFGCEFKDKINPKVQIFEYQSYDKRYNLFLYLEIAKILKNFGADILHTHGAKATQMGFVLAKFIKFTHIATKHNVRKGTIFNRVANIISMSKSIANTINHESEILYFGLKEQKVEKKLNAKFSIIAVGRLDFIKGFDELIKAVSRLKFDFVLNIVGDGNEKANLQNLINSLNLQDKVKLCGFQNNIAQLLANSHLQVIASRSEGLSISLIEGIFYSNVLLGTRVGGIPEILDESFLIDYENMSEKIAKIFENYDFWVQDFHQKHKEKKEILKFQNYMLALNDYYQKCVN